MKTLAPLLTMLVLLPAAAQPLQERLGTVHFAISCKASSQAPFDRGVALLHDFWYPEARVQFQRLVKSDPDCAIAHWGVAMTYFHQIWDRPDAASMTLGWEDTRKAQSLRADTAREHAYIAALADFYHPGADDYPVRIAAYSAAIAKVQADYPDDVDAGAFYALSLLAAKSPDETSVAQERKAMAVLKPLF